MSAQAWKPGREAAERALRGVGQMADNLAKNPIVSVAQATWDRQAITALGVVATANALLAVEERLGELVAIQRQVLGVPDKSGEQQ